MDFLVEVMLCSGLTNLPVLAGTHDDVEIPPKLIALQCGQLSRCMARMSMLTE